MSLNTASDSRAVSAAGEDGAAAERVGGGDEQKFPLHWRRQWY
jgi:hypothetical protein